MRLQLIFIGHAVAVAVFFSIVFIVAERERAEAAAVEAAVAPVAEAVADAPMPPVEITPERLARGEEIYKGMACIGCHSTDGTIRTGPSLAELYGRTETLSDGTTVQVDETYLRESLLAPNAKVVKGFVATMPSYRGMLSEEDVRAVVAWIKQMR